MEASADGANGADGVGAEPSFQVAGDVQYESSRDDGEPGCPHYKRRCKFVTPCCDGEVFWCRHCHDEVKHDGARVDPKLAHQLERRDVQEVVCAAIGCGLRQPVSPQCIGCGSTFGAYFCEPCRFYDDEDKGQFHCDGCGLCRVGGSENYFHCEKCVACLPLSMRGKHKCIEQSLQVNCPVCLEYLHSSLRTASILKCGHTMHTECQKQLFMSGGPRCPICNESMEDMSRIWELMDEEVAQTQMPLEYAGWEVEVLCNDCHLSCLSPFHVVGLKCSHCGSYNTRRTGSESPPSVAAATVTAAAAAAADNGNNSDNGDNGGGDEDDDDDDDDDDAVSSSGGQGQGGAGVSSEDGRSGGGAHDVD